MSALDAIQMDHHSFTMEVAGINIEDASYEDNLYSAGCSDALIIVVGGHLRLDFDRLALSFGLAVETAIKDISRAGGSVTDIKKIES